MKNKSIFLITLFITFIILHVQARLILIESGEFLIGEEQIPVILSYNYLIGKTEITNGDFLKFLNESEVDQDGYLTEIKIIDLDSTKCDFEFKYGTFILKKKEKSSYPVASISWFAAVAYCNWLSEQEGLSKAYDDNWDLIDANGEKTEDIKKVRGYRLPTEAEWEYAAKGGVSNDGFQYSGSDQIDEVAWYSGNSNHSPYPVLGELGPHPCRMKKRNSVGLYDMSGNALEWCHDQYAFFEKKTLVDPLRVSEDIVMINEQCLRVVKGGGWDSSPECCQITYRFAENPNTAYYVSGFRIVRTQ